MSIAEIIKKLEMAYNEEDWGIIEELIESLSVISEIDDPFMWKMVMMKLIKYGAERYRLVLFDSLVQQGLSKTRTKRLITQTGEFTLDGLEIDWHLAEYDYSVELPIGDSQPSYAFAA